MSFVEKTWTQKTATNKKTIKKKYNNLIVEKQKHFYPIRHDEKKSNKPTPAPNIVFEKFETTIKMVIYYPFNY